MANRYLDGVDVVVGLMKGGAGGGGTTRPPPPPPRSSPPPPASAPPPRFSANPTPPPPAQAPKPAATPTPTVSPAEAALIAQYVAKGFTPAQAASAASFATAVSNAPDGAFGSVLTTIANTPRTPAPANPIATYVPGTGVVPLPGAPPILSPTTYLPPPPPPGGAGAPPSVNLPSVGPILISPTIPILPSLPPGATLPDGTPVFPTSSGPGSTPPSGGSSAGSPPSSDSTAPFANPNAPDLNNPGYLMNGQLDPAFGGTGGVAGGGGGGGGDSGGGGGGGGEAQDDGGQAAADYGDEGGDADYGDGEIDPQLIHDFLQQYAQPAPTAPAPAAPAMIPVSAPAAPEVMGVDIGAGFWSLPLWRGAPVRRWHAAAGLGAVAAMAAVFWRTE